MKMKYLMAALLLAAVAAPAFASDDACLMRRYVDGWGARDEHSMIVNDRFGRKYLVKLAGVCGDLDFAFRAGFRSFGGPSMCIERGDHVVMRGGGAFPHSTCWVTKVMRYTPDMEHADRAARAEHKPLDAY